MSTGIQWTDETWNPVVGCTKVSQGCKHCYAKTLHDQRHKAFLAGKKVAPQYAQPFETVQLMPQRLLQPLSWRKPKRAFVNSVSDLFHEDVSEDFLAASFGVMAIAHHITFQILTKRPERMREIASQLTPSESIAGLGLFCQQAGLALDYDRLNQHLKSHNHTWPLPNVWLGVSVENQAAADERIPVLLDTPAAVRFLSCEPLLGPIDFYGAGSRGPEEGDPESFSALTGYDGTDPKIPGIDWVIVGGESGAKARECDLSWIRHIVGQCKRAEVPCFVKQLGAHPVDPWADTGALINNREPAIPHFRDSHGGDPSEWPEDFRVREFPAEVAA